jgi:hypothetical protein
MRELMSSNRVVPKLVDLVGPEKAEQIMQTVHQYDQWKQAMQRKWLDRRKSDTTQDIDKAYQAYEPNKHQDGAFKTAEKKEQSLKLLSDLQTAIDKWIDKKLIEYQSNPAELKTHQRFLTILGLKEFCDDELKKIAVAEASAQANARRIAGMQHLVNSSASASASSNQAGKVSLNFLKLHAMFAPPNILAPHKPSAAPAAASSNADSADKGRSNESEESKQTYRK